MSTQLSVPAALRGAGNTHAAFRNDAVAKVSGRAQYADDFIFPRMVHGVPVFPKLPHGRIIGIHTSRAEASPGVLKVFTWKDVPGKLDYGQINHDMPILAHDKVRHYGDAYALVVAETRKQALAAAALVELEAEALENVFDPAAALAEGAPVIGGEANLVAHHRIRRGDPDTALDGADFLLERTFSTAWFEHAYLEPEGAVCFPRQDGVLEVYGSLQHPVSTRRFICAYLNLPFTDVEVYSHPVGGSFGGKDDTASVVCARAALAARILRRPVKIIYDREWSFLESYKRPPYRLDYRMGFRSDGRLLGAVCDILADSGPYTSSVPWSTWRSTVQSCGPYRVDHVRTDVRAAATNNPPTGAFRGFGSPQVNFCTELLMDQAAEALKISPLEIRRRNMVVQGSETITGQVLDTHTVSLGQVMETVAEEIGFEEKLRRCSFGRPDGGGRLYGIGLAIAYRGASVGAEARDFCSCVVNCQFDGSILLETGIHENGQGAQSAMILVLTRELGVSRKRIRYAEATTSQVPEGGTTVASRGTLMGSAAVHDAVRNLKKIIAPVVAQKFGCGPDQLLFVDDRIESPHGGVSWDGAMRMMYEARVYPFAFGSFKAPDVSWNEHDGSGEPYFTYVYSCQAVELEVDVKSAKVKLLNIVAAHDVGRAVNPEMLKGQIYGGISQGIGMALFEDLAVKDGLPGAFNYNRYKIPKAADMPEILPIIVENADPTSPFGCKGIGEPALELIAPAIAGALYRATGNAPHTLPMKTDEIMKGPEA
jgi:CO/xanthine dehydrogenase Mo-binding subunit